MPIISTPKTLRDRDAYDHYPTPLDFCYAGLSLLPADFTPGYILDPGAGEGVWGEAARALYPNAVIVGTDIRPLSRPHAYDYWYSGGYDFLMNHERGIFDLVIGNPPFGKRGTLNDRLAAEKFVRRSLALLTPGGFVNFLLPLTFLAGQRRAHGLYRSHPLMRVGVHAERPSFTADGKTDATEYAAFCWQDGFYGKTEIEWLLASAFAESHQMELFA